MKKKLPKDLILLSAIRKENRSLYQKAWEYVKENRIKNYPDEKGRIRISQIEFEIARLKAKQRSGNNIKNKLEEN